MSSENVFDFISFQEILINWPAVALPEVNCKIDEPILGRILQILHYNLSIGNYTISPDFIVLIRQLLSIRDNQGLRVPTSVGWPDSTIWEKYSFSVIEIAGQILVEPKPWIPEWLNCHKESNHDLFQAEFSSVMVRKSAEVPMDPFLTDACNYDTYVCPGQREAVRSLLFMPAGETIIVNLPTGAGKSLVGLAPVLFRGLHNGLTLFIVPTKALALDLARRMHTLLSRQLPSNEIPEMAWHSGRTDDVKRGIKQRIRQGSQGILFASPEAMTGSLLPALHQAAKLGSFKYLVIDEAHLVAQWGDSFRPAFQELSGVRRGLLRRCAGEQFRTILMSATLSKQTVATLDVLFGPSEHIQMVSAVHLRPEPRYFSHKVQNHEEKKARVLELLRNTPRPFILYVTERKHADDWLGVLKQEGYIRVDSFHGNTDDSKREEIIDRWAHDNLDGIIATSAFGVGMDKEDIRTVIHAGVPESLDRYYQEVGRGGRDGRASLSVVIYTDRDENVARSMSQPAVIGDDNAYKRWQSMYAASHKSKDEDLTLIDLTVVPPHLGQQTDYNADWNMRTLILLTRAGLIELDSNLPDLPERNIEESDEEYDIRIEEQWDSFFTSIPVRTLDPHHLKKDYFEKKIGEERNRGAEAAELSFNNLMAALRGEKEMSDVLAELFSSNEPSRTVIVSTVCRGCSSRTCVTKDDKVNYQIPPGLGIEKVVPPMIGAWDQFFPWLDGTFIVVLCPEGTVGSDDNILQALQVLVSRFGIKEISATSEQWKNHYGLRQLHTLALDKILIRRTLEEDRYLPSSALPLPRVSLLLPWENQPIPEYLLLLSRPLHIIFAPESLTSSHPLRRYQDDTMNHIRLEEFLRITTQ